MDHIKPFDVGYATYVENKFNKPVYKIHLNAEKLKELETNSKGIVDLSIRYRQDGKAMIAYQNLYKSQGVKDERNFINIYVSHKDLKTAYESDGKICILATPKDPSKKAINDFSKADYNIFSFQNNGSYIPIGSGFTNENILQKEKERIRELNKSEERHQYIFVGSMNSNGELTLNDTHLQKYVDQNNHYTSLNLLKADNSGKYYCYISNNSRNEVYDYKFTMPTQQLLNLPYHQNEIRLQGVNISPDKNKELSNIAIMTRNNFDNAYHNSFVKDLHKVEIEHRDVICFGYSLDQFFKHLKAEHAKENSKDKSIVSQPKLFEDNKNIKDVGIPHVNVIRDLKPPSINNPSKDNSFNM